MANRVSRADLCFVVALAMAFGSLLPHSTHPAKITKNHAARSAPIRTVLRRPFAYEEENNLPHVVDGRLATPASSINELLSDIVNSTRF